MIRKIFSILILTFLFIGNSFALTVNELLNRSEDPVLGNPRGKVALIEFFDYQCSHCSKMAPVILSLIQSNSEVKFIFKELPIRGAASDYAARAALAAAKQGKYFNLSYALLTSRLSLTQATVLDIAKSKGLNLKQLQKDMESRHIYREINNNYEIARDLDIQGTPAFIVMKINSKSIKNARVLLGSMSRSELQDNINQALN